MSGESVISVQVDGFYSEEVATKVGMDIIRRENGVTGSEHVRTYQPRVDLPTRWRVEGTYPAGAWPKEDDDLALAREGAAASTGPADFDR